MNECSTDNGSHRGILAAALAALIVVAALIGMVGWLLTRIGPAGHVLRINAEFAGPKSKATPPEVKAPPVVADSPPVPNADAIGEVDSPKPRETIKLQHRQPLRGDRTARHHHARAGDAGGADAEKRSSERADADQVDRLKSRKHATR